MTFGERIREARKRKKLTQKELANLINAKHNSISNWENNQNKPDPDTLETLCWALGVTPNYLLGVDDQDGAINLTISDADPQIDRILSFAKSLNAQGLAKLGDYAEDLVASGKYEKIKLKERAM